MSLDQHALQKLTVIAKQDTLSPEDITNVITVLTESAGQLTTIEQYACSCFSDKLGRAHCGEQAIAAVKVIYRSFADIFIGHKNEQPDPYEVVRIIDLIRCYAGKPCFTEQLPLSELLYHESPKRTHVSDLTRCLQKIPVSIRQARANSLFEAAVDNDTTGWSRAQQAWRDLATYSPDEAQPLMQIVTHWLSVEKRGDALEKKIIHQLAEHVKGVAWTEHEEDAAFNSLIFHCYFSSARPSPEWLNKKHIMHTLQHKTNIEETSLLIRTIRQNARRHCLALKRVQTREDATNMALRVLDALIVLHESSAACELKQAMAAFSRMAPSKQWISDAHFTALLHTLVCHDQEQPAVPDDVQQLDVLFEGMSELLGAIGVLQLQPDDSDARTRVQTVLHTFAHDDYLVTCHDFNEINHICLTLIANDDKQPISADILNLLDMACDLLPTLITPTTDAIESKRKISAFLEQAKSCHPASSLTESSQPREACHQSIVELDDAQHLHHLFRNHLTVLRVERVTHEQQKNFHQCLLLLSSLADENKLSAWAEFLRLIVKALRLLPVERRLSESRYQIFHLAYQQSAAYLQRLGDKRINNATFDSQAITQLIQQLHDEQTHGRVALPSIELRQLSDKTNTKLLQIFLEEAELALPRCLARVSALAQPHARDEHLHALSRELHTLKGSARMVSVLDFSDLAHSAEDIVEALLSTNNYFASQHQTLLDEAIENMIDMVEALRANRPLRVDNQLLTQLHAMHAELRQMVALIVDTHVHSEQTHADPSHDDDQAINLDEMIRIHPDFIEQLVSYNHETSHLLTRSQNILEKNRDLIKSIRTEQKALIVQLHQQEHRLAQRGAMALSSSDVNKYTGSSTDIAYLQRTQSLLNTMLDKGHILEENYHHWFDLHREQARVQIQDHDALLSTRMIPFATLIPRIMRIVKRLSQEMKKAVDIEFSGQDEKIDRIVANRLVPIIDHIIRNAIDHGIESEAQRVEHNKPAQGHVMVTATHNDTEFVVTICDDGAGIDIDAVRDKIAALRLVPDAEKIDAHHVPYYIFKPGVTTAQSLTQTSGRGVGMDIVAERIKQLGGDIELQTQRHEGTTFILRLPLLLSTRRVLPLYLGTDRYAIGANHVQVILQLAASQIYEAYKQNSAALVVDDQSLPLMSLHNLLGFAEKKAHFSEDRVTVIVMTIGHKRFAVHCDGVLQTCDVVVKSLTKPLHSLVGIIGSMVFSDGEVGLMIDLNQLVEKAEAYQFFNDHALPAYIQDKKNGPVVLFAEDAKTVREALAACLDAAGYRVLSTADGYTAWRMLAITHPDTVIIDLDMPLMNGLALIAMIRRGSHTQRIPVILLTASTNQRQLRQARLLGVETILSKPCSTEQLLHTVQQAVTQYRVN